MMKICALQIKGCTVGMHMHATEAWLYRLNARWESTRYGDRERAILAQTESVTCLAEAGAPDADYDLVKQSFTEAAKVNLTLAIGAINLWNPLQEGQHATVLARDAA
jgi:alkylhydroperoxidase family enzyme